MAVVATYNQDEFRQRSFRILLDGKEVAHQSIERGGERRFFDVEYAVPPELAKDKKKITVRFQADAGSEIGAVYGIRMIRSDPQP